MCLSGNTTDINDLNFIYKCKKCSESKPNYLFAKNNSPKLKRKFCTYCKDCMRKTYREWRHNNPEKVKEAKRKWSKTIKGKESSKAWKEKNKNNEEYKFYKKEYLKKWNINNREKANKYTKEITKNLKKIVFDHYGNTCQYCSNSDKDVLVIDHVFNNGSEERKKYRNSYSLYKKIKEEGFPNTYQILCRNCNFKKQKQRLYEECKYENKWVLKIKNMFFDVYGNKCNHCGETNKVVFTLDHKNNDGYKERKVPTINKMNRILKTQDFDNFQCLCHNCNWKKHINGGVLP